MFEPCITLCADSSEPGACFRFCVSTSLCPSHAHTLSLHDALPIFLWHISEMSLWHVRSTRVEVSFVLSTVISLKPRMMPVYNKNLVGVPGWLSQLSIWLRLRSWSHVLWVRAPHQALYWQLRAWSLLQIQIPPLSLCPTPACAQSLSVFQKWINV